MRTKFLAVLLSALLLSAVSCGEKAPPNLVNSPEDVKWKKIGAVSGTAAAHYTEEYGESAISATGEAMLAELHSGVTDCALTDASSAESLIKSARGIRALEEPLFRYEFAFAIAKENADLTADVNAALQTLEGGGVLRSIRESYLLGTDYRYSSKEGVFEPKGVLVLGLKGDFPPYAYPDGDAYRGIDVDVCRAVCDIIGVELEIKAFPNDELITMIRYGKADIAAGGLYPSEDSGEQCDFSVPYASCEQVILVRK